MRQISFFFFVAAILFGANVALAGTGMSERTLLRPATGAEIPLPAERRVGSTFFAMDAHAFESLATWKDFVCTLENIEIPGIGSYTARVEQFDVVDGSTLGHSAPAKHVFFRGSLDGAPGSHVCLTFFYDRAYGYINIGDRSFIMAAAGRSEQGDLIVGISEDTTPAAPIDCGTKEWTMSPKLDIPGLNELVAQAQSENQAQSVNTKVSQIKINLAMDDSVVNILGKTDTSAFKYAMSVVAAASDLYMRDANVALIISEHIEFVGGDPYDALGDHTACELLDYFNNSIFSGPKPSLYVLMSGRHTDWCGGVAADIDVLGQTPNNKCVLGIKHSSSNNAMNWLYPYTSWTWDAMVCAHEIGHVVACAHTHNCYFYNQYGSDGPIDSCYQAEGSCFQTTKATKGTIMSYCHLTTSGAMLKFHPLCDSAIKHSVARTRAGAVQKLIPVLSVSSRTIQSCSPVSHITITANAGTAPYSFEISSFNVLTDSVYVSGNVCQYWLSPSKPNQKYYLRVTTADTVRVFDSVTFIPGTLQSNITIDEAGTTQDSVVVRNTLVDNSGAKCTWYAVGAAFRQLSSGWTFKVVRPKAGDSLKYFSKVTSGSCTAQDTITVYGVAKSDVEMESASSMRLYPNPAHDRLSLILPELAERVWIADALGREVSVPQTHARMQVGERAGEQIEFSISHLPIGSYWIVRETNGATQTVAFQKQ